MHVNLVPNEYLRVYPDGTVLYSSRLVPQGIHRWHCSVQFKVSTSEYSQLALFITVQGKYLGIVHYSSR